MDKEQVINHPKIKALIEKLNLNENQIESGLYIFIQIIDEIDKYLDFYTSVEVYDENNVVAITVANKEITNEISRKKYHWYSYVTKINPNLNFDKQKENNNIFKIQQLNPNIFYWSVPKLNITNRGQLALWFKNFFIQYKKTSAINNIRGLYLYGEFGNGKTTFMNALANYIINLNKTIAFLNTNDLFEYLKKYMNESKYDETNNIIEKLKNLDCLFIDNIGFEKVNEWFLFSILLPIFEYRLKEHKLTCFNSNLSLIQLEKYYLNHKLDKIKTKRFIDRIDNLTSKIMISGKRIKND